MNVRKITENQSENTLMPLYKSQGLLIKFIISTVVSLEGLMLVLACEQSGKWTCQNHLLYLTAFILKKFSDTEIKIVVCFSYGKSRSSHLQSSLNRSGLGPETCSTTLNSVQGGPTQTTKAKWPPAFVCRVHNSDFRPVGQAAGSLFPGVFIKCYSEPYCAEPTLCFYYLGSHKMFI